MIKHFYVGHDWVDSVGIDEVEFVTDGLDVSPSGIVAFLSVGIEKAVFSFATKAGSFWMVDCNLVWMVVAAV